MSRRKILYVTANPTKDLATDVEYRDIRAEMERGSHRDVYEFLPAQFAVTIGDLLRATNDKPYLIHFSGHGQKQGSIITDEDNNSLLLPLSELKSLLKSLQGDTQMVLFNSCSSSDQAREISELGMYVIGYNFKIGDKAAIDFAKGFYNGLGEGKSLRGAFRDGLIQLNTLNQGQKRGLRTEEDKNPEIEIWKNGQKQKEEDLDDTPPPLPETPNLIPRLLTTPPFVTDYFIGRDTDLKVIESQFQKQNKQLFLMNGEGGIGKTTLAAQYWHSQEKFYQHLAWIFADTGVGNALLTLANKLEISFEPKTKFEEQVETVLLALNKLNAPCLLVLDNVNDANDLEKHYVQLKKLPNFHILLTTRVNELADAPVHKVLPLDETDAIALFKHHYASFNDSEEDLLKSILHAVGYNTLVIELLAKNLAVHNKFNRTAYTLSNLLNDLREKGLLEIQSRAVKVTYRSDTLRQAKPEEIIRAMYDLSGLNDFEKYLLSNFAVLPAENIPYDTLHDLLKPERDDDFEEALGGLQQKGWIEYTDNFRVSPVVQAVVRDKSMDSLLLDCKMLISILLDKLERDVIYEDNYKNSFIYIKYAEAIVISFKEPNYQLALLYERIGRFYSRTGSLEKANYNFNICRLLLNTLCKMDFYNPLYKHLLSISSEKLSTNLRLLGDLPKSLSYLHEYHRLAEQLYKDYPREKLFISNLAIAYEKLGILYTAIKDSSKALEYFEKNNILAVELIKSYPNDIEMKQIMASSYEHLGNMHRWLKDPKRALMYYKECYDLSFELFECYPKNILFGRILAISYFKLGDTNAILGNLEQALIYFQDFNCLAAELNYNFSNDVELKNDLIVSYQWLGLFYETQLGNKIKSKEYYILSKNLSQQLVLISPLSIEFKNNLAWVEEKLAEK